MSIVKEIDTPAGVAKFYLNREGITAVFPAVGGPDTAFLDWDKITDMEIIADKFGDAQVKVFRVLVEKLGEIHQARHIFEVIL